MRAIPQSTVDRARRLCAVHPQAVAAQIMNLHPSQISRMKGRNWKEAITGRPQRAIPTDFQIMAHRMSFDALVQHYEASEHTIAKWLNVIPNKPADRRRGKRT